MRNPQDLYGVPFKQIEDIEPFWKPEAQEEKNGTEDPANYDGYQGEEFQDFNKYSFECHNDINYIIRYFLLPSLTVYFQQFPL